MDQQETVGIVIVGAGPAGLSTALHLVQDHPNWGEHILILEKEAHPRLKLCGGGITRLGLRILKELGFSLPLPLPQAQVENIFLQNKKRTIHVRGKPLFIVIDRSEFDSFLAQKVRSRHIRIQENEAVTALEMAADHVKVITPHKQYLAQVVVGADSVRGPVRAWLRSQLAPGEATRRIGRTLEFLTPADLNAPHFIGRSALFDFSFLEENLQGYFWDFPSYTDGEPTHNRGVYDARFVTTRPRAELPRLLNQGIHKVGISTTEFLPQSAPIHWFNPKKRLSMPRVLLVGDAAGVDGLFGEGIGPALAYGKIAAAEIIQAFSTLDFCFEGYERRILHSSLGRYLLIRWLLAKAVYRFGPRAAFMHALWSVSQILATIWQAKPLD